VLLVDDVQFISGKESTQEEFFHTFNALYTFNKQIVLASDRPPHELDTLEDRLRSRFEGGLVVDIPPLEFETRVAILQMWAQERDVRLPMSVLERVADRSRSSVRELEGVFNQIIAKAQFAGLPFTVDSADRVLQRFDSPRYHGHSRQSATLDEVIAIIAQFYQMKPSDLIGKGRAQRVNTVRQVAMFLARELTDASLVQIGDALGGRSHTTVLHGCNKMVEMMELDPMLCDQVGELRTLLHKS
jgi:chromosomal replication initiator protein